MNIIKSILFGFSTGFLGCIIQKEIDFSSPFHSTSTDFKHNYQLDDICNFQISENNANEDYFFEDRANEIMDIPLKFENLDIKTL